MQQHNATGREGAAAGNDVPADVGLSSGKGDGGQAQGGEISSLEESGIDDDLFADADGGGDMDLELQDDETDRDRRARLSRTLKQRLEAKRKAKREAKKNSGDPMRKDKNS